MRNRLPPFHPQTLLRDFGGGQGFRIADALTGTSIMGSTGSGKTSGPGAAIAYSFLAAGFGGLVCCAKKEELRQWQKWAADTGRSKDLIVIDKQGSWRFNFLDDEASRPGEGGGFTINIVALLDEVANAVSGNVGKAEGGGGSNRFWDDALHHMNSNLVDLPVLAGLRVSLPLLRSIVISAPQSIEQVQDASWRETSACAAILKEADLATIDKDEEVRCDFEECRNYWLTEFPSLGEKTRSIITLTFSMLVRPLVTRPLRKLFSTDTNVTPQTAFDGKLLIVNLPVQEFRLAGKICNLIWKYSFQVALLRRTPPAEKNQFLRPCFLWCDEFQNFCARFDSEFVAVARSAGGCVVYMTQNRESLCRVLGNADAVDSLLANLNFKVFCANTGDTNEWASRLLGERWLEMTSTNISNSRPEELSILQANRSSQNSGVNKSMLSRRYVEPSAFTTLLRGGELNDYKVEAIVYSAGHLFPGITNGKQELLPYALLTFDQR